MESLMIIVVLFIFVLVFIFSYLYFEKKNKGYELYSMFYHDDGLVGFGKNIEINIEFYKDKMIIADYGGKVLIIPYNQVKDVEFDIIRELVEKKKSLVARGVVGGAIFGLPGLILGGLSGLGNKAYEENQYLLLINYIDPDGIDKSAFLRLKHEHEVGKTRKVTDLIREYKKIN